MAYRSRIYYRGRKGEIIFKPKFKRELKDWILGTTLVVLAFSLPVIGYLYLGVSK